MEGTLVNKVANSGLITLNLEEDFPIKEILVFDIKDYLFHGLILKEKDFRMELKSHSWEQYEDKILCIYCSTDAIVPIWAYMLVAAYAQPIAADVFNGTKEEFVRNHYRSLISARDYTQYQDVRVVIKGCSNKPVPETAYLELTKALRPYAQSIMYGEPCSTVPIFKRPRVLKK